MVPIELMLGSIGHIEEVQAKVGQGKVTPKTNEASEGTNHVMMPYVCNFIKYLIVFVSELYKGLSEVG